MTGRQSVWKRLRWYATLPVLWLLAAVAGMSGGSLAAAGAVAGVVVTLAVVLVRLAGASGKVPRARWERRTLWVTGAAALASAFVVPNALTAGYQATVMERHDGAVAAVDDAGYAWRGRQREVKVDRVYVRVDDGSLVSIEVPASQQLGSGDEVDVWVDPLGWAEPRLSAPGWIWPGCLIGVVALLDSWIRRRHRAWWGPVVVAPDVPVPKREKGRPDPRRPVRWLWGVAAVFWVLAFVLALRDPAWQAVSALVVAGFGVPATLGVAAAWQRLQRRPDGSNPVGGWFAIPMLLVIGANCLSAFVVPWVVADAVVAASVPAEPATVVEVQDREVTDLALERRDSGSVVVLERPDGSRVTATTSRTPDEIHSGDRVAVRVPDLWALPRLTDDGPPTWASVAAVLGGVLLLAEIVLTLRGYRRLTRDAPTTPSGVGPT